MARAPKGSRQIKRGKGGWYVRFTDADGKRRQCLGGRTKAEAEAFLAARKAEAQGRAPVVRAVTLGDALPTIMERQRAHTTGMTPAHRERLLRRMAAQLGRRPMSAVTVAEARALFARLSKRLAASTLRAHRGVLSSAWQDAIDLGFASENPWRKVRVPQVNEKPVPYLSPDQIAAVIAAMPERARALVTVIADTGLRISEATGLRWENVREAAIDVEGKGGKWRTIPLTTRAAAALEGRRGHEDAADVHPFRLPHPNEIRPQLNMALSLAGVKGTGFHVLRHAFASGLVRAGVPITDVQRLLGHKTITQTMRYAVHAPEDAGVRAIRALERHRGHG